MKVFDRELYAISQAIKWIQREPFSQRNKHQWIFTDSQSAIQRIISSISRPQAGQTARINKDLLELQREGFLIHIHWIPGHQDIKGNVLADTAAKQATDPRILPTPDRFASFSHIKRQIKAATMLE